MIPKKGQQEAVMFFFQFNDRNNHATISVIITKIIY